MAFGMAESNYSSLLTGICLTSHSQCWCQVWAYLFRCVSS